jgi:squalene-associated FAD-dependent desaturase
MVNVLVVGGGLAGIATAVALAERHIPVTILESKPRLGGRASSFVDPATGDTVDLCQHVAMGCCTEFLRFCETVGIRGFLQPQPALWFMTSDGRTSRFAGDPLPAPLHLFRSFVRMHTLTLREKIGIALALRHLRQPPPSPLGIAGGEGPGVRGGIEPAEESTIREGFCPPSPPSPLPPQSRGERGAESDDPPFSDWLAKHRQSPRMVDRFWGLVLTSALNETPDRVGFRYARKVFVDGFLTDRRGFEVELPTVPLGRLYGPELSSWLEGRNVRVVTGAGVRRFILDGPRVTSVELRTGDIQSADAIVSAVPFERLIEMLPSDVVETSPYFANLRQLTHSPITSVHCWFDRPATEFPHVVLVDCLGQWVFNRGPAADGEHYLQVVVSAARRLEEAGRDETERQVVAELRSLFPPLREATLKRVRVITDRTATFSAVPGVDRWRPAQKSPLAGLYVAGDWTATGWPATMEGAVRSGNLAAAALMADRCLP